MTTQKEYILDRLGKGDVPVTCFVGEFSNYATIQGRRIASIFRYHTDTDQYEDSEGELWSYAVPVQVTPINFDKIQP